jgi:hypothetical protein
MLLFAIIWFHDADDEFDIVDKISLYQGEWDHCGDFFGWYSFVHHTQYKLT